MMAVAMLAVIVTMTMTVARAETVTTMTIVPLVGSVANSAVTPLVPIRQSKTSWMRPHARIKRPRGASVAAVTRQSPIPASIYSSKIRKPHSVSAVAVTHSTSPSILSTQMHRARIKRPRGNSAAVVTRVINRPTESILSRMR